MADTLLGQAPLEMQPELQGINRQQQMAQMLMQQAFQQPQGQMISGRYVAPGLLQQLQPLLGAYVGTKGMEAAENKQLELAKSLREVGGKEVQDIMNTYKTDPNLALQKASVAQSPQAKALAAQLAKSAIPETPSSVREFEYAQQHPELVPYLMNKAAAGAARTSLNVQNQLPFKEQIQKEAATGLMKNFETLQNIPSTLQNMDKMVKLSQQPIYAGVGGETKLQIAKLLNNNFGTNIAPETVKNTEEFKSAAYMGIMENLKKTDSNPTMAQQNALKDAIGSLGTDPSALPRVVNVMRDVLVNKAENHNRLVQQTMQNGVQYPYSIEVPLPKAAPAGGGIGNVDTSSLDAILRSRGALK